MQIPTYSHTGYEGHEPTRPRKLLLHRKQIDQLAARINERGLTLVPLRIYFKGHLVKVELGLARASAPTTSASPWPSATPSARWPGSARPAPGLGSRVSARRGRIRPGRAQVLGQAAVAVGVRRRNSRSPTGGWPATAATSPLTVPRSPLAMAA